MKKLFFFASAVALLATACSDDLEIKSDKFEGTFGNTRLVASFSVGADENTRTEMVNNPNSASGKSYKWSKGDAIGVFAQGGNVDTNAQFSYVYGTGTAEDGSFTGDLQSIDGTTYYGYYPYYQNTTLTDNGTSIQMSVNKNQNYNHDAVKDVEWSWEKPLSGSFASGSAPSVAYGILNTANQQLNMQFNAVTSFFVVPMMTYEPVTITKVTLQILNTGTTTGVPIAGDFNVTLDPMLQGYKPTVEGVAGTEDMITLNCGQGVELAAGEGTNFWFVVPAQIKLEDKTIEVKVYANQENEDGELVPVNPVTFQKPMTSATTTIQNQIYRILNLSNNPWEFNTSDDYLITNIAQFLEYAYLVTNGTNAIQEWVDLMTAGGNMNYSSLQEMVKLKNNNGESLESLAEKWNADTYYAGVKNAKVIYPITFNTTNLKDALTGLNLSGLLPAYYANIYQTFYNNGGWIKNSIGGRPQFTLSAIEGAELTNLSVIGNGLFANKFTIDGLVLNNPKINVEGIDAEFYTLLGTVDDVSKYTNVTVNNGIIVNGEMDVDKEFAGLFNSVDSSWIESTANDEIESDYVGVVNNTDLYFANYFNLYSNFTFNSKLGVGAQDMAHFTIPEIGYSFTVDTPDTEDVEYIINHVSNDEKNGYSILGNMNEGGMPTTSFWTGTQYNLNQSQLELPLYTAERLAYTVTDAKNATGVMNINLNLMGNYTDLYGDIVHMYWVASQKNPVTLSVEKGLEVEGVTVENIYISGYDSAEAEMEAGTPATKNLSLFGYTSQVYELTVKSMTINVNFDYANIAALSTLSNGNSIAHIDGYTVNIAKNVKAVNYNTVGGLYTYLQGFQVKYAYGSTFANGEVIVDKDSPLYNEELPLPSGLIAGTLAIDFNDNRSQEQEIELWNVSPIVSQNPVANPFGKTLISITPSDNVYTSTLTLKNFPANYYNRLTLPIYNKENWSTAFLYTFQVIQNSVTTQNQWLPDNTKPQNSKWTGWNTLSPAPAN